MTQTRVKCSECEKDFKTDLALNIHKSKVHKIRGPNYKYSKYAKAARADQQSNAPATIMEQMTEASAQQSSPKKSKPVKPVLQKSAATPHWRYCPACGVNQEALALNMASAMPLTSS